MDSNGRDFHRKLPILTTFIACGGQAALPIVQVFIYKLANKSPALNQRENDLRGSSDNGFILDDDNRPLHQ